MLSTNAEWPQCAYSYSEVQLFSQMLAKGCPESVIENPALNQELTDLLTAADKSFELEDKDEKQCRSCLVQIEGCGKILNELPQLLNSVFQMKIKKEMEVNCNRPEKCLEIRRDAKNIYYHSTIINGNNCNCAFTFGGESWKEAQEKSVRAANNTIEGLELQTWVMNNLLAGNSWYRSQMSLSGLLYKCCFFFSFLCIHATLFALQPS